MDKVVELIGDLVSIVGDYENCEFNEAHVERWIGQFPQQYHELILSELNHTLSKTYISKEDMYEYVHEIINNEKVLDMSIQSYNFLNIQIAGESQSDLLEMLKEEVEDSVDLAVSELDNEYEGSFVYIDDVFYTGNRLLRDIENWLEYIEDVEKIEQLVVIYYFAHTNNLAYRKKQLRNLLPHTEIIFKIRHKLENNIKSPTNYDAFLPSDKSVFSNQAARYITNIDDERTDGQRQFINLLRPDNIKNNSKYIKNEDNRKILEHVFFEEGVEILTQAINSSFKPMGYDYQPTLGFGSMVVTYRNSPNNGPLVFWWGNEYLDNWYPLFPRIVY